MSIRDTKIYLQLHAPENIKKKDGLKAYIIFFRYCYIAVETLPGMGAKLIRAQVLAQFVKKRTKTRRRAVIKLKSGEHRTIQIKQ